MRVAVIFAASLVLVSGCGGGETAGGGVQPIAGTKSPESRVVGLNLIRSYDAATDTVTVTLDGYDAVLSADQFRSQNGIVNIEAYSDALQDTGMLPEFVSYRMITSSGETSAEMTVRTNVLLPHGYPNIHNASFGSNYARHTNTGIPLSGTTTMNGRYVGAFSGDRLILSPSENANSNRVIYGDVEITVDFGAGTVGGQITNRRVMDQHLGEFDTTIVNDLALTTTRIANDGSYSGATSGGQVVFNTPTETTGTYTGLVSGANATETAGVVNVIHPNQYEYGIFVAE